MSTQQPAQCLQCGRERTDSDGEYSPIQVVFGSAIGWYSGEEDGEICGDCMTRIIRGQ